MYQWLLMLLRKRRKSLIKSGSPFMCGPRVPLAGPSCTLLSSPSLHTSYPDLCLLLCMHKVPCQYRTFAHAFLPKWHVLPSSLFSRNYLAILELSAETWLTSLGECVLSSPYWSDFLKSPCISLIARTTVAVLYLRVFYKTYPPLTHRLGKGKGKLFVFTRWSSAPSRFWPVRLR